MNAGDKVWFFDGAREPSLETFCWVLRGGMIELFGQGPVLKEHVFPDTERGMQNVCTAVQNHILMLYAWQIKPDERHL